MLIITILLTLSLTACTNKPILKPDCVKPIIKVSEIQNDRDMLTVLNELVTLVEQQESTIECWERAFK